jgi:hypothetical protein
MSDELTKKERAALCIIEEAKRKLRRLGYDRAFVLGAVVDGEEYRRFVEQDMDCLEDAKIWSGMLHIYLNDFDTILRMQGDPEYEKEVMEKLGHYRN